MVELLKLLFSKKGFSCRVLPPGSVYASKVPNKQLVVIIDLDSL
mgnify:CR=1 FL=1